MFWFKKKEIVVDCFTSDPFSYEYAPISPAIKYYPAWWKKLPYKHNDHGLGLQDEPTMRSCRGFTELYKNSFVIPFWGRIRINISNFNEKKYYWKDNLELDFNHRTLAEHAPWQFEGFTQDNFQHIKIFSPWIVKTNKSTNFILHDCVWNKKDLTSYNILPGISDFKYTGSTNINLMFEYKNHERFIEIEPGHPLAMLTPITGENILLKTHLVTTREIARLQPQDRMSPSFASSGKKFLHYKKFMDDREKLDKPQCPLGFKK